MDIDFRICEVTSTLKNDLIVNFNNEVTTFEIPTVPYVQYFPIMIQLEKFPTEMIMELRIIVTNDNGEVITYSDSIIVHNESNNDKSCVERRFALNFPLTERGILYFRLMINQSEVMHKEVHIN